MKNDVVTYRGIAAMHIQLKTAPRLDAEEPLPRGEPKELAELLVELKKKQMKRMMRLEKRSSEDEDLDANVDRIILKSTWMWTWLLVSRLARNHPSLTHDYQHWQHLSTPRSPLQIFGRLCPCVASCSAGRAGLPHSTT